MKNNVIDIEKEYRGRILTGDYSERLRGRVNECIGLLANFEKSGAKIIPYISAWHEEERIIWYEFAGKGFCDLLQCNSSNLPEAIRSAIIDRRAYYYTDREKKVEENIITRDELQGSWKGLREEVTKSGEVDAVYKVAVPDALPVWLKDQASIESFKDDSICISIGFLTNVTKEMELKDLFEKIGYIDELTRLPRRSILERILEINIGNFQRGLIDDFIVIMVDVDHFKKVNDTYGHPAGDYVLATLAEVMTSTKRKEDEIGRYGGEEFYGFTIGDISLGVLFAERLRHLVENTAFVYEGQEIPITVSIGLASAAQLAREKDLTSAGLISIADKKLYEAKEGGRNKVVS